MSVQTGTETPRVPASQQLGDRLRFRLAQLRNDPNPLWMREMRQSTRLVRTPIFLMVLTILMTLLMSSLGGVMTGSSSPAYAGLVLFNVYFSVAYFVVTLIGPALAANSVASEREGKTWEAVLLTGMRPSEITRGKFLAAYTAIAQYVVMLAPVGAVPFLFGGVTPLEVLIAFVFLFLIALLSVAFGLAISSKMASMRGALLVTLLLAIPISIVSFSTFGVGLSYAANNLWPAVPDGPPVWLPAAYGRAPFDIEYLVYLVALPTVGLGIPAWFLYEVTRANLTSITDDRYYGLKRWYLASTVIISAIALVPLATASSSDHDELFIAGLCGLFLHQLFCCLLFTGEAIGPSRRVQKMLNTASRFRRLLSPALMNITRLQLVFNIILIACVSLIGTAVVARSSSLSIGNDITRMLLFAGYAGGFLIFVIGLSARLRARSNSAAVPRILVIVTLFALSALPWIVAAIAGALNRGTAIADALLIAAPSPFYVFLAISTVGRSVGDAAVIASVVCSFAYAFVGLVLIGGAHRTCRQIINAHEATLAEADRRLAEEDDPVDRREHTAASPQNPERPPTEATPSSKTDEAPISDKD